MRNAFVKGLAVAAAAVMIAGCDNAAKKAAAQAQAQAAVEQARQDSVKAAQKETKEKEAMDILANLPEEPVFDIITNLGVIKVKLYSKTPKHRENFAKLALEGYYDSLLFHRVIKDFMIQAGDPYTRDTSAAAVAKYGQGGPGYTIPAEFVSDYQHIKGALAAARQGDLANPKKASSGSQFYLVQSTTGCAHLNGDYTVFGQAVQGYDVIDKIASVPTDAKGLPVNEVRIKRITLDESSKPKPEAKAEVAAGSEVKPAETASDVKK